MLTIHRFWRFFSFFPLINDLTPLMITCLFVLCFTVPVHSIEITVTDVAGRSFHKSPSLASWKALRVETSLGRSSSVRTESLSFADLRLDVDNRFRIMENSEIEISSLEEPHTLPEGKVIKLLDIKLYNGEIGMKLDKLPEGVRVDIEGPSAVASALGTSFMVAAEKDASMTSIDVIDNKVLVMSRGEKDKGITVSPFRRVNVIPWENASIEARGTGILPEELLEKQRAEGTTEKIIVKVEASGANREKAREAALSKLGDTIFTIKIDTEKTIADVVHVKPELTSRLFMRITEAAAIRYRQNNAGTILAVAEIDLAVIEEAIDVKIDTVFMPVYEIPLLEYSRKFGTRIRLMTKRAAIVESYRNLAERIHGVVIDSRTTLNDFVVKSDMVRTRVEGIVKRAKVIKEVYFSDGSTIVTTRISGREIVSKITQIEPEINFGINYVSSPENIEMRSYLLNESF